MATVHLRYTLNHEAPIAQITLLVVDERCASRRAWAARWSRRRRHGRASEGASASS